MYLTFSLKYQLSNKKLLIEIFLMLLDGLSTNGLQKNDLIYVWFIAKLLTCVTVFNMLKLFEM